MDRFYVISNPSKDKDFLVRDRVIGFLERCGKVCFWDPSAIPEDVQVILVLGGDGTMIRTARSVAGQGRGIPLLGINLGTLGYLAEVEMPVLDKALEQLVMDDFTMESRMMLSGEINGKDGALFTDIALNDIVISRAESLMVIDFKIFVNGEFLNLFSADGIIIATPTGSTAYSLSAGGPIVSPQAQLIVVTPICPHTLNSRSIVLSADDVISIVLCPNRRGIVMDRLVSFDGENSLRVSSDDVITIHKAQIDTKIVRLNKVSFLEVLRKKFS